MYKQEPIGNPDNVFSLVKHIEKVGVFGVVSQSLLLFHIEKARTQITLFAYSVKNAGV